MSGSMKPVRRAGTESAICRPIRLSLRKLAAASLSVWAVTVLDACSDTSAPIATASVATLTPASPTTLTATVDSDVGNLPSVLVGDMEGKPIPGVVVNFLLTTGEGALFGSTAKSNSAGIASLSGWRLGTSAGVSVVTATSGPQLFVTFRATALAGPPATIVKVAGDNQISLSGSAVAVRPQVRVTDEYANPVAGMAVMFVVAAGGGSLTGEFVITDSLGIATLGSWTLGPSGGQSLVATAGSLTPLMFGATSLDPPHECLPAAGLAMETPVQSALNIDGCQTPDGRSFAYYSVALPVSGSWQFQLVSDEFDTLLELRDERWTPIASNRNSDSTKNSEIKALLPSGVFNLVVTSAVPGAVGRYDVSYKRSLTGVAGCEISIARGVQVAQVNTASECPLIGGFYTDRYRIYMTAGSSVSIVLEDYSLSDNRLEIQDDNGRTLAVGVIKDYVESNLDYTAPADGYYVISVQTTEKYVLYVQ